LTLGDTIEFEVFGRHSVKYVLPATRLTHHWLPPLD